jgi:hypothetical protein
MGPVAIALRALSAWCSPEVIMLHVMQRRDSLSLSIHDLREQALTLVLRSTHSKQLSVGLFRFCFFLAG